MKYNLIILVIAVLLGVGGCKKFGNDFLAKPPSVDVTKDTIFSNLEYAERFLWGAYKTLPYGMPWNWDVWTGFTFNGDILESLTDLNQCDLVWAGSRTQYYNGAYNAGVENNALGWGNGTKYNYCQRGTNWKGIRTSYIFIANIGSVPGANDNIKKQLAAEARMVIAVHYSDMYRHYGGLPWVTHAYTVNENTNLPRLTSLATMDSIVALINKAIPDLPWTAQDEGNWDGRFTKAAAMGLKARVLLFGASPLFNSSTPYLAGTASTAKLTWHGGYDANLWVKAASAAHELIAKVESEGGYALVKTGKPRQDYEDAYHKRGNGELLITSRVMYKPNGAFDPNYLALQIIGWYGVGGPTNNFVEFFPMANGKAITDPTSGYDPTNPLVNRDPRLYETILVDGDSWRGGLKAQMWVGGNERPTMDATYAATGFSWRKFRSSEVSEVGVTEWPFLRLPEIYLSYAEAQNEVNNGPDAETYRCVNIVRNRVGLGDLPPGLTKEQFREAVLTERTCEFGYEEVRWFDLIRWKREADFQKAITGLNIFKDPVTAVKTYVKYNMPARYWKTNFSPKWYLSAFPPNEIDKGYGLIQNPGWE